MHAHIFNLEKSSINNGLRRRDVAHRFQNQSREIILFCCVYATYEEGARQRAEHATGKWWFAFSRGSERLRRLQCSVAEFRRKGFISQRHIYEGLCKMAGLSNVQGLR